MEQNLIAAIILSCALLFATAHEMPWGGKSDFSKVQTIKTSTSITEVFQIRDGYGRCIVTIHTHIRDNKPYGAETKIACTP